MTRYLVVGWYSTDACDPHVAPFSRSVTINATSREAAYSAGYDALLDSAQRESMPRSVHFLNWFVSAVQL